MSHHMRHVLVGIATLTVVGIGSAIALATDSRGGVDRPVSLIESLDEISAASDSFTGQTVLDADTARIAESLNTRYGSSPIVGRRLINEARVLPGEVDGKRVYVIPTSTGMLCVFLEADTEVCAPPLSAARPASLTTLDSDGPGGDGATVFGVAMDGVASIEFKVANAEVAIPVKNNLFVFHGSSAVTIGDVSSATASLTDGSALAMR